MQKKKLLVLFTYEKYFYLPYFRLLRSYFFLHGSLEDMSDHETLLFSEERTEDLESDRKFDRIIILR